jgi:hypothetical protein
MVAAMPGVAISEQMAKKSCRLATPGLPTPEDMLDESLVHLQSQQTGEHQGFAGCVSALAVP